MEIKPTPTLDAMLSQRTHRDLELIARAHGLPFTRREPKAVGLAGLAAHLNGGAYRKAFDALPEAHIAPLHALVAAGGWLPLAVFTAHFGEIRPYKPWRWPRGSHLVTETTRHPWRYPCSVAERLVHLGFVVIHEGDMVYLVDEIRAWLPALPRPEADMPPPKIERESRRAALLRDVAALLGVILQHPPEVLQGRWLPLSIVRAVNARLSLPEDLSEVRSELQSGRLRWLHYLAQVAGLLAEQDGRLVPTASAWHWLSAPPDAQWDSLMQAVERDLAQETRLWDVFRFPAVSVGSWHVLRHTFDDPRLPSAYRVRDLLDSLRPYLLPESPYVLASLLREVFTWAGMVVVA